MNLPGVRLGIKKYAFYTHSHVFDKVNDELRKNSPKCVVVSDQWSRSTLLIIYYMIIS